jgi:hypothetical protein
MLNSTYLNAADPNSMRDIGPTRNCAYVAQVGDPVSKSFNSSLKKRYTNFMIPNEKYT